MKKLVKVLLVIGAVVATATAALLAICHASRLHDDFELHELEEE